MMENTTIKLFTPSKADAAELLKSPMHFRRLLVCSGALPPAFLLERALLPESGEWLMPRLFVDPTGQRIVGSGGFKSTPQDGKIEIGYAVSPDCHGRGYATDAVRQLCEQAFASGHVHAILAETALANLASKRVLEKAGFIHYGDGTDDDGPVNRWHLKMKPEKHWSQSGPCSAHNQKLL